MDPRIEKVVDTLLREYELHRKELLLQIQIYNRQTQYIQLYGALLLGFLAFLSGSNSEWIRSLISDEKVREMLTGTKLLSVFVNPLILMLVLGLAAVIAFYLVSAVMASSYLFLIIRRRMAHIEQEINTFLEIPELLAYESKATPHFLEKPRYGKGITFTPHFLSGIWRIILFACIIFILCLISRSVLDKSYSFPFSISLAILSIIQVGLYIWLNSKGKRNIDIFYKQEPLRQRYMVQFIFFAAFSTLFMASIVWLFYPNFIENITSLIIDLFRNIYLIFLDCERFQLSYSLILLYIYVYNLACAIFWPTPSEAPLLFYHKLSLLIIILISALGKASGAYIAFLAMDKMRKLLKPRLRPFFLSKESIERLIANKGFLAYLFMQGVPFMPMRTSILAYSFLAQSGAKVALGAGIGTVSRNLLMLLLFRLGYESIKALLGR